MEDKKITLKIKDLSCASCAQAVEKGLKKAAGVKEVQVNFASKKAYIKFDPEISSREKLIEVVRNTGYDVEAEKDKITFDIDGMNCAACSAAVEKALNKSDGVYLANVNIATEKGSVEYDPDLLTKNDFREIVKNSGYELAKFEDKESEKSRSASDAELNKEMKKVKEAKKKMWGTWAFTIPIIEYFFYWAPQGIKAWRTCL